MKSGLQLRLRRWSALAAGVSLASAAGCVPLRGGWDAEALERATPALQAISRQRLGDMVPYPALLPTGDRSEPLRLALVACRFEAGTRLRVRTGGPGWSEPAGAAALAAFSPPLERFDLSLERTAVSPAEIDVYAHVGSEADAPEGLGDTLVECDVSNEPTRGGGAAPRGIVRRAEVRMRRSGIDAKGLVQRASDDAWIGALLHELAHALGFSGHAATGRSLLVRDEGVLREIGRDVLKGKALTDPTLAALYTLPPGQILGERPLTPASETWLRDLLSLDAERERAGVHRTALVASVGDREARLAFRYADGTGFGLRFPGWPRRLRAGGAVVAIPDAAALAALRGAEQDAGVNP